MKLSMDSFTFWLENCPLHFSKSHGQNLSTHPASCIDLYWRYFIFFRHTWRTSQIIKSIFWYHPDSRDYVISQEKHHCNRIILNSLEWLSKTDTTNQGNTLPKNCSTFHISNLPGNRYNNSFASSITSETLFLMSITIPISFRLY